MSRVLRPEGDAAVTDAGPSDRWVVRDFDAARDADAVCRLDTSYTSDQMYVVRRHGDIILLEPQRLDTPRRKRFPIDLGADAWEHGRVAVLDDVVRGFIAWALQEWNRRMAIWHFYIDLPYRRRGGGRILMDAALEWARRVGAVTAWLETSQVNHPGIVAYRRLGFDICGFDTTLYRGTSGDDETALYMARLIDAEGAIERVADADARP
jgi:GNAT superfamily N-acetyltransferase